MSNKATIVFAVCFAFCVASSSAEQCVACDSSKDSNCATNREMLMAQSCKTPNIAGQGSCYARIVSGVTYRGCSSELDEGIRTRCLNQSDAECFICENGGAACNNIIFPTNRVKCHTCSATDTKSGCFTGIESISTPCKSYVRDDKCYIRKTVNSIERGCLSDTAKCTNISHCFVCDGDGCNNYAGNNTMIPTAPSSAVAWTSTMTTVVAMALISFKLVA